MADKETGRYLTDLTREEMIALAGKTGSKPFHGKILYQWIFQRRVFCFEEMTDLSKDFRNRLEKEFSVHRLKRAGIQRSGDGTEKILYRLPDDRFIETVKIPETDRLTLCLSTQVGCSIGCRFCASGQKGLKRNLSATEIVEQVLLTPDSGHEEVTNIVFMGIGEPLLNLENLCIALQRINDPHGPGLGARRITVSTVGIPEGIRRLADLGLQINLAISLHAADEEKRAALIPIARSVTMESILDAADYFRTRTTRDVTYEVLLIGKVNDGPEDAEKLARLLKGKKGTVNLIVYNAVRGLPFEAPSKESVAAFKEVIVKSRIPVTLRRSRGSDISAACGQLYLRQADGDRSEALFGRDSEGP